MATKKKTASKKKDAPKAKAEIPAPPKVKPEIGGHFLFIRDNNHGLPVFVMGEGKEKGSLSCGYTENGLPVEADLVLKDFASFRKIARRTFDILSSKR